MCTCLEPGRVKADICHWLWPYKSWPSRQSGNLKCHKPTDLWQTANSLRNAPPSMLYITDYYYGGSRESTTKTRELLQPSQGIIAFNSYLVKLQFQNTVLESHSKSLILEHRERSELLTYYLHSDKLENFTLVQDTKSI